MVLRIYVDFNARHVGDDVQEILVSSSQIPELKTEHFVEGERVKLHDEETECEAILKVSKDFPWISDRVWVGQIIKGTIVSYNSN